MTLPRTGLGSTSLGAVGGPRGVAAGGLRVLIEFISQYDPAAVKQLEADLSTLEAQQGRFGSKQISLERQMESVTRRRAQAENILTAAIAKQTGAEAAASRAVQKRVERGLVGSPTQRKDAKAAFTTLIADLKAAGVLSNAEAAAVSKTLALRTRQKSIETQLLNNKKAIVIASEQEAKVSGVLGRFQALKAGIGPKLGGLALGALGGLVGGAVIGAGFALAQELLDKIGGAIQDLIDPARHARETVKTLADTVEKLADEGDLTRLQALKQVFKDVGISLDDETAKLLQNAIANQKVNALLDEQKKLQDVLNNVDELRKTKIKEITEGLVNQAREDGKTVKMMRLRAGGVFYLIDGVSSLTLAEQKYAEMLGIVNRVSQDDINIKNRQAAATFALKLAQDALNAAASAYTANRSSVIDQQIEGLREGGGESARTRALQKKIDSLSGGGGSSNRAALQNIAEERQLILLRQRLRLLGSNINLEKYSGKFLLEAINAKLSALQKEAAAQDRLNKLLDIQFRMSKGIRRNEGETINDFLERRAQENRNLLSEQRDLERQALEESLKELQEKTQDEVALRELAEQKKNLLAQAGTSARLKNLQKELKASQDADRKALQAKIDALEAQKRAVQLTSDEVLRITSAEHLDELQNYIRMSRSMSQIAAAAGEIRGLEQAKEFLKAILSSGILPPEQAKAVAAALARVLKTLGMAYQKLTFFQYGPQAANADRKLAEQDKRGYAEGGFIPLRNSQNPFGNNVRFGERGTEGGMMVFPNNVMNRLKNRGRGPLTGDIHIYPTESPYASEYRMKEIVRQVVREEIGA